MVVMNKTVQTLAVGTLIGLTFGSARSQVDSRTFCALLDHYFTDPPSAFINERGEQISAWKWKSNRDYPNARCTIGLTKRATHIAQCKFNEGASAEVALSWYKMMESNIEECISKRSEHGRYRRDLSDFKLKDGTKVTETEWENNDLGDAYHSIEISTAISPNGRRFTSLEFNYRAK